MRSFLFLAVFLSAFGGAAASMTQAEIDELNAVIEHNVCTGLIGPQYVVHFNHCFPPQITEEQARKIILSRQKAISPPRQPRQETHPSPEQPPAPPPIHSDGRGKEY